MPAQLIHWTRRVKPTRPIGHQPNPNASPLFSTSGKISNVLCTVYIMLLFAIVNDCKYPYYKAKCGSKKTKTKNLSSLRFCVQVPLPKQPIRMISPTDKSPLILRVESSRKPPTGVEQSFWCAGVLSSLSCDDTLSKPCVKCYRPKFVSCENYFF